MVYFHIIPYLVTTLISCILGIFVFFRNTKNIINRAWCRLGFAVSVWSLGFGMMLFSRTKSEAVWWGNLSHVGASLIPIAYLHFILSLTSNFKEKVKLLYLLYGLSLFFAFSSLTPWLIKDYSPKLQFNYYFMPGLLYPWFIITFFIVLTYAFYKLINGLKTITGYPRNRLKYVLIASWMGFGAGATTFPLVFGINLYPLGGLVFFYNIIITYAIIKYHLMDVRVAITRTGIFVAVYSLVLGLPFAVAVWYKNWLIDVFGAGWWMLPLGLMAALATVGPFIYIYLDRKAEEKLLREQKRYQQTLKQASVGMTRIRNLRKLLDLITHIVTKTVRISYAAIYLYNRDTDEYILQVSRDKGRIAIPKITSDNPLVSWIMLKREPLIYEEIKRQMEDTGDKTLRLLEENMRILTATVIIPSFLEDRFMGFFVLGEKVSGQIYTPDDLNVFQVLASQAALAIENAQFYDEAKELQEQIAQAEKMATVGTMADGLSHQINNRFHALALITGDTIDTIKLTDTSKCTPEVREMIDSINHALERIQSNVLQGGEVVRGILKYSRKGDAGFEAINLDDVINNTLEMVQFKVKLSEVDIIRDYNNIPKIKANMTQLEEVFFNFIDNAYDATVERRTLLKEDGYRGKITISAKPKESALEITVADNGMGIKDEENKKIFTPFFTTKTSSRKGTGLGLYVIRRIITDSHKGKVSFESQYKVGTRFIVELPIAK